MRLTPRRSPRAVRASHAGAGARRGAWRELAAACARLRPPPALARRAFATHDALHALTPVTQQAARLSRRCVETARRCPTPRRVRSSLDGVAVADHRGARSCLRRRRWTCSAWVARSTSRSARPDLTGALRRIGSQLVAETAAGERISRCAVPWRHASRTWRLWAPTIRQVRAPFALTAAFHSPTCFLLAAPAKALLAHAVSLASTSAIALTLGGDTVLPALGIRTPDFLKSMQASKLQTCAAAWFLGNTGALLVRSIFALCSRRCWRSASKPDQHRGI